MSGTATTQDPDDTHARASADAPGNGAHHEEEPPTPVPGILPPRWRLVTLTFLMLFVELALIRWLGARVVYMSYYSNFVLLASFLGFGLGFLWAGCVKRTIYPLAPLLLGLLVAWVAVFDVPLQATTTDVIFFETIEPDSTLPRWSVLLILFIAVAMVTAAIGDGVARTFGQFEPLEAYKLDLIGSVLGIAGFTFLSFLGARPIVWGLIIAGIFVLTLPIRVPRTAILAGTGIAVLMVPFAAELANSDVVWSPYYRITHQESDYGGIDVEVNQSPHWTQLEAEANPMYTRVYERLAEPRAEGDVLIIGAGSGNDVAIALEQGADHVDAVEIDPRLMELARDNHPDRPYEDDRVTTHIDDGRAFLERTDKTWDRILLALPDSLALVQGQSAIRLESYLFTTEAVEIAREHLKPGGVFAMYNWYRQDWLVDRYANTLASSFDVPPCVSRFGDQWNLSVLVASNSPESLDCPTDEVWEQTSSPAPVTDDRPFPYIRDRSIPMDYVWTAAGALALSLLAIFMILVPTGQVRYSVRFLDMFFMGVAFLLLETKSVAQFALLFGTTWLVNALVFMGVLGSVLVAVAVSRRITFRRPARLYLLLLAALALAYVVPPGTLLELAVVPRFLAGVTLAFFPIFTANLIFTQRFKDTAKSTVAFGANLLGAMVGGLLEYASLITGFKGLLVVVGVAYGLALLAGRRHITPPSAPGDAAVPAPAPART